MSPNGMVAAKGLTALGLLWGVASARAGAAVIGQLTDPAQPAEAGYVDILSAFVEQDGGLLTFVIETRGDIPTSVPGPEEHITFIWLVDADNDPATGQPHEQVGSEFNVRAVISPLYGGGFVDVTGGMPGGGTGGMVIAGNQVRITVGLGQIANPATFHWSCDAWHAINNVGVTANHETAAAAANTLPYTAPARVTVLTPLLMLSPAGPATAQLQIEIRDAAGNLQPTVNYHLDFQSSNEAVASVNASGLVTAHAVPVQFNDTPAVEVRADGIAADSVAIIRVTGSDLELTHQSFAGRDVSFYLPPIIEGVDLAGIMTQYQVVQATDQAYAAQRRLTGVAPFNGGLQHLVLDITNDPATVPCGISGNPIRLGWEFGKPVHNSCFIINAPEARTPQWGVFFHEMGHNFTWPAWSFGEFCSAPSSQNGTYSEGLATLCGLWSHEQLMSCPAGLRPEVTMEIDGRFAGDRAYFLESLAEYQDAGAHYAGMDANVLDGILIELRDIYGLQVWFDLFSTFTPSSEPLPCSLDTEAKQATWIVAAASVTAGDDLRGLFAEEYGFPIDDDAWPEILAAVEARIAARPWLPSVPADFDCDQDVDLDDFGHFQTCASGPSIPQRDANCTNADLDGDGDVDQEDFGVFQRCYSGSGQVSAAACPD
ncbi:MAG: hypothetical protein AMXMBFR13_38290 [Phycisphaerae bacterium]